MERIRKVENSLKINKIEKSEKKTHTQSRELYTTESQTNNSVSRTSKQSSDASMSGSKGVRGQVGKSY